MHSQAAQWSTKKVTWQKAGRVTEPGATCSVRLADGTARKTSKVWSNFPKRSFTLVEKPDAGPDTDEYHLGLFELPTGPRRAALIIGLDVSLGRRRVDRGRDAAAGGRRTVSLVAAEPPVTRARSMPPGLTASMAKPPPPLMRRSTSAPWRRRPLGIDHRGRAAFGRRPRRDDQRRRSQSSASASAASPARRCRRQADWVTQPLASHGDADAERGIGRRPRIGIRCASRSLT